jgi:hypothetical protein
MPIIIVAIFVRRHRRMPPSPSFDPATSKKACHVIGHRVALYRHPATSLHP